MNKTRTWWLLALSVLLVEATVLGIAGLLTGQQAVHPVAVGGVERMGLVRRAIGGTGRSGRSHGHRRGGA